MKKYLGLFALVVMTLVLYAVETSGAVAGVAFATLGGTIGNTSKELYRINLQKTVNLQIWLKSKLSQMLSVIDYDKFKKTGTYGSVKDSYSKLPKQAIVHVIRDLKSNGGVELEIPILVPMKGKGVTGTQVLEDTGTPRGMFQSKTAINMKRRALQARDNEMSYQAMPENIAKELMSTDGADLKDWFSRFIGFEAVFSTLEGYSTNLSDATYGGGYSKKSHPNFYVQGNGKVTFSGTFNPAYEDAVATGVATLTDTAGDRFNAQSIKNMVYLASKHKIQPLEVGGKNYFVIFISSAQARDLRQDAEWVGYQKEAASRGSDNTLFTGALEGLPFEGAYIIVDGTIPKPRVAGDTGFVVTGTAITSGTLTVGKIYYVSVAGASSNWSAAGATSAAVGTYFTATATAAVTWDGGTLLEDAVNASATNGLVSGIQYGVSEYMDNPQDEGSRNAAILYGQGAIHFAEGKGFKLTEMIKDHGQKVEVGGTMIYGATRPDIFDHDNFLGGGAHAFVENSSSLVYCTHDTDDITI